MVSRLPKFRISFSKINIEILEGLGIPYEEDWENSEIIYEIPEERMAELEEYVVKFLLENKYVDRYEDAVMVAKSFFRRRCK